MYTIGQEVLVQIGSRWIRGEILKHHAGYYKVYLYEHKDEIVGWYYCDSITPNLQLELEDNGQDN